MEILSGRRLMGEVLVIMDGQSNRPVMGGILLPDILPLMEQVVMMSG